MTSEQVGTRIDQPDQALRIPTTLTVIQCLGEHVTRLERHIQTQIASSPSCELWQTVKGIGPILAQTLVLETGDRHRCPTVGDSTSSCRCVESHKISHGKRKGKGHVKNGHAY